MICPVEIAGDMSALRAARVGDHAEHGYPLGKEFRMELTVRVIDQAPSAGVSEQVGRVN